MTVHEVGLATGISEATIRNHIKKGYLNASYDEQGQPYITCAEVVDWAKICWDDGKYLMHDPSWIYKCVEALYDPIERLNRNRKNNNIFER